MTPIAFGDQFDKHTDLQERVEAVERATKAVFFKERSLTIETFLKSNPTHHLSRLIKTRSDKAAIVNSLKYRWITYRCDKGGRAPPARDDRRRVTKSKKGSCNACIAVTLDDSMKLFVKHVHLEHNHPVSETTFSLNPRNRRLSEDLKALVRQHIALGADKSTIRNMLLTDHGIIVTRNDLNNVLRVKSRRDVGEQVEFLSQHGFSSVAVVDKEAGVVCGILFQDSEMKSAFKDFPELLLLDATYKGTGVRTSVVTVIGVDSMGLGVPLALFLPKEETTDMIECMLKAFKAQNPEASARTKVWLTDIDAAERNAISKQFPHCQQFLCTFHVLQAFRRDVESMPLAGAKERDRVLRILQRLPYASFEEEYWCIRRELGPGVVDKYLRRNWDGVREEWVHGLSGLTMDTVVTKHLQSLHAKLKNVFRFRGSFETHVEGFTAVLSSIRAERKGAVFSETSKRPTDPCTGELECIQSTLTSFAFGLVREQYQLAADPDDVEPSEDGDTCSCAFFVQYGLPCQHIIAFRRSRPKTTLFPDRLLPQRWRLSHLASHLEAKVVPLPDAPTVEIHTQPPVRNPLSKDERFTKLSSLTEQIALAGAQLSDSAYVNLHANLGRVLDLIRRGQPFLVKELASGGLEDLPVDGRAPVSDGTVNGEGQQEDHHMVFSDAEDASEVGKSPVSDAVSFASSGIGKKRRWRKPVRLSDYATGVSKHIYVRRPTKCPRSGPSTATVQPAMITHLCVLKKEDDDLQVHCTTPSREIPDADSIALRPIIPSPSPPPVVSRRRFRHVVWSSTSASEAPDDEEMIDALALEAAPSTELEEGPGRPRESRKTVLETINRTSAQVLCVRRSPECPATPTGSTIQSMPESGRIKDL